MESLLRTALLLACAAALGAAAGALLADATGAAWGAPAGLLLGLLALAAAGPLLLHLHGARRVDESAAPQLVRTVHELALRAGVAPPAVHLIDDDAPIALATGGWPPRAAIALSTGLLALLSERELRAAIGHELAHIRRGDVHMVGFAAALSGALVALALAAIAGDTLDTDVAAANAWTGWPLLLLAALPLRLAAGRAREFDADRLGARISGDARALADALFKIERAAMRRPPPRYPQAAMLLIVAPRAAAGWRRWLTGHPPTAERIARLRAAS